MATTPRTPPRFVPTLTTVLEMPSRAQAGDGAPATPPASYVPSQARSEARAVEAGAAAAIEPSQAIALSPQAQLTEAEAFRLEEQLLHRVLQRIDLSLEEKLSDAVSAAVQHHLDSMIPRLRHEIEVILRALVSEALASELSENPGSTPPFDAQSLG